ncbi:heat shock protein Hsp90 [Gluconacetobacter diazotrophicus PA1 5]|uniref:Chaperone protein HtpG n=1 Tax=Gluconacetobacter diazotrophicus TaxID=33996 RepID=A0A7W4FBS4_GLUDI|nr:molecular chaperone HtpG [Gluconacetobacter diazotrophicus]ACI50248.1 heat shock protein Hsp90 [Gluconacetobacter diazotrophicus PA1 5]MBB2154839.1 molecular chaperone HtpG [Gluconacetobacter diazotrophicus]TWB07996.1 molecular chaperone HtpG [Gluconacetobacter diazotrophicus]
MTDQATDSDKAQPAPQAGGEEHAFSAEVGRLLDLVVHALYSEREIFLRELVANAADATDRRRFEALTDAARTLPEGAGVRIDPDKDARRLTISDDGAGMSKDELARNLGTIARSGTRAFGQELDKQKLGENAGDRPSLIGQFGVGFYAAFMVADHVDVVSRRAGSDEAWRWSSDGKGSFTLSPATRERPGTDIVLYIKEDADEFLDAWRLESIVRKWADHIAWPITIRRDGEDTPANAGTALWRKPKGEVTEEQLTEFYRHVSHNFDTPWATLHWHAEGTIEFTALLFIPGSRPFEFGEQVRDSRVRLHVRRMFITDDAALLPPWMRFVQGVVDTEDLPLNVSREMLQATPVLARIRKAVTNRVLNELRSRAKDAESYATFWDNFGPVLKEGIWDDAEYRTDLAGLARFRSSTEEGWTTLADYVSRMKDGQEAIYYLTGDNPDTLPASPQLEGFRARGIEVLLLSDPVDSFWPDRLGTFEGKALRSVSQGHADLDKFEAPQDDGARADLEALLPAMKAALGEAVSDVRGTNRLVGSAVVLSAAGQGPDLQLQRLLRRSGQAVPDQAPVLEINATHPLIRDLADRVARGESVADIALILLDIARIQDGESPKDPTAFANRLTATLTQIQG